MKQLMRTTTFLLACICLFDCGEVMGQWTACEGLDGADVYDMVISDSSLFISGTGNGIFSRNIYNGEWQLNYRPEYHDPQEMESSEDIIVVSLGWSMIMSLDYGNSWFEVDTLRYNWICNSAIIDGRVFIATESGMTDYNGIMRSDDNGITWQSVFERQNIPVDLSHSNDNLFAYTIRFDTIFQSGNYGETWYMIKPPNIPYLNKRYNCVFYELNNRIYLGTNYGVFLYPEHLGYWIEKNDSLPENTCVNDFCYYNDELYIATSKGVFKLDENTSSWSGANEALPVHGISRLLKFNDLLYCSTPAGVFFYEKGLNWYPYNDGLNFLNTENLIYAKNKFWVKNDCRIFKSENDGMTFELASVEDSRFFELFHDDSLLFKIDYSGFSSSNDECIQWTLNNVNLLENRFSDFCATNQHLFVLNQNHLFRSNKDTILWDSIYILSEIPSLRKIIAIDSVLFMFSCYQDTCYMFRSLNEGITYDTVNTPTTDYPYYYIDAVDGSIFLLATHEVYYSENYGNNWGVLDLDSVDYYSQVAKEDNVCIIHNYFSYYVFGPGIYLTDNDGETWNEISDGLPKAISNPFSNKIVIENNIIYTCPRYNGLWYRDDIITIFEESFSEEGNKIITSAYPNPCSSQTTIQYSLTEPSLVTIDIFDQTGRYLETLCQENQPSGLRQAQWKTDGYATGIYFYRVGVNGRALTGKIIKLD